MIEQSRSIACWYSTSGSTRIHPFTDWQNDLHLIIGTTQGHLLCLRLDLAKLITAATGAFSGAHSIGSAKIGAGMFAAESYTRIASKMLV